jgi:lipoprotein-anchoring transpeptidase ErfK/SrfK
MFRYFVPTILFLFSFTALAQEQRNLLPSEYIVQRGESIYKIAQKFDLGVDEILLANPLITDSKILYAGQTLILPNVHIIPDVKWNGIVINLAEMRLYYFEDGEEVNSFPISIGADEKTPIGKTKISAKREKPTWTPPASIREENPELPDVVPAGPKNPLGNYALNLDASHHAKWQGIMIHGTNNASSIGSKVSHGCIRLYPQDIENLFSEVEVGTPVEIVNQPLKVLEIDRKIYIEVHLREAPDLVSKDLGASALICKKVQDCEMRIDWNKVDEAITKNLGVPVAVNRDAFND